MSKRRYTFRQLQASLGVVCRQERKERGWTLDDAAKITGVRKSGMSKIENGKANPCLQTIRKLIDAYGPDLIRTAEWLAGTRAARPSHGGNKP